LIPQQKPRTTHYFPALTGVRTVAAGMIYLHHFNFFSPALFGNFIHDFVSEFHVGVTIFFVLSGFLIYYLYADFIWREKKWLGRYFLNRFARIYPMYFLLTIIMFLPGICQQYCSGRVLFLNLSFLRGFFDEFKFTGISSGWSLTVEETFYTLFPLIIFLSSRIRLALQPLLFIGIGILLLFFSRGIDFHGFFSGPAFLFEFTFFGRCFEFFAGMWLARFFVNHSGSEVKKAFPVRTVAGILLILLCISLLVVNRRVNTGTSFLFGETIINNFSLPFGICLFFYGLLVEQSLIRRILSTPLFSILGKSSYIFYMIHNGVLFVFFYNRLHMNVLVIFVLLQLISILLYKTLEKPINVYIRRVGHQKLHLPLTS